MMREKDVNEDYKERKRERYEDKKHRKHVNSLLRKVDHNNAEEYEDIDSIYE